MQLNLKVLATLLFLFSQPLLADTGSKLIATGGITSVEGSSGGGITPWALIAGYASKEEINATANLQQLATGEYQLTTYGAAVGLYDKVELSLQKQVLSISSGVTSNVFALLTDNAVTNAASTKIEQTIVGAKYAFWGDAVFADNLWLPQLAIGFQYKKNHDFNQSLFIASGEAPLPNTGVPQLLGATDDSGVDWYLSATKHWLAGAYGRNLLVNATLRRTKANTLGLLGFGSASDADYQLELEGSIVLLPSHSTAIGVEFRQQSNRLGGLAGEKTITDFFIAYFPNKHWSVTAAYVDLGHLPYDADASGFYLSITGNL